MLGWNQTEIESCGVVDSSAPCFRGPNRNTYIVHDECLTCRSVTIRAIPYATEWGKWGVDWVQGLIDLPFLKAGQDVRIGSTIKATVNVPDGTRFEAGWGYITPCGEFAAPPREVRVSNGAVSVPLSGFFVTGGCSPNGSVARFDITRPTAGYIYVARIGKGYVHDPFQTVVAFPQAKGNVSLAPVVDLTTISVRFVPRGQQTPGPTPRPSPNPSKPSTAVSIATLPGPVTRLIGGGGSLYAIYSTDLRTDRTTIARLDPRSGRVVARTDSAFPSAREMALAGPWLWATTAASPNAATRELYRLDPITLKAQVIYHLQGGVGGLASAPAGLWVAEGPNVVLRNASTGAAIRSAPVKGMAGALGADPKGRRLYVATSHPNDIQPLQLMEFDATTGQLLAGVPDLQGVATTALSATNDGVWESTATGLQGAVRFLRTSDLRQTANYPGGHDVTSGTNGVGAEVVAGWLWVHDSMGGTLACADPSTGQRIQSLNYRQPGPNGNAYGFSNATQAVGQTYIGYGQVILRLPASCG